MGRDVAGLRHGKANDTNQTQKTVPEKVEVKDSKPDDQKQDEPVAESSTSDEPEEKVTSAETDDSGANDQHSPTTTIESQPNSSKPRHFHDEYVSEGEENSSHSSRRTNKFKVTVPVGPRFVCEDRLERRKEYYSKLEEKHKALEKEKHEAEARQREEEAAAIKQLRKTMVYKANPVPSFYREGPPPKVKIRKLPLTRPKSPVLTRRRSCGDAGKGCSREKEYQERAARRSPSTCRAARVKKSAEISSSKDDALEQEQANDVEE